MVQMGQENDDGNKRQSRDAEYGAENDFQYENSIRATPGKTISGDRKRRNDRTCASQLRGLPVVADSAGFRSRALFLLSEKEGMAEALSQCRNSLFFKKFKACPPNGRELTTKRGLYPFLQSAGDFH
jgi:hypothetical protein